LWIEVRIVGILLRATLLHLVAGCEARWWIVETARIITIIACAVTAAITASGTLPAGHGSPFHPRLPWGSSIVVRQEGIGQ